MLRNAKDGLNHTSGIIALLTGCLLTISTFAADLTNISIDDTSEHQIRYTSGKTIYIEGLVDGKWVGRYWCADGRIPFQYWLFASSAFEIGFKDNPASETEIILTNGWQWVSATELNKNERNSRHFTVELSNSVYPLRLKVHTLLDGTAIITRWLEITNESGKSIALTSLSPWSGRLLPGFLSAEGRNLYPPHTFRLGYQTRSDVEWEGWFEWQDLVQGTTMVESTKGDGQDDPFFILHHETKGAYFIGHLAWSANWRMAFEHDKDSANPYPRGLSFRIGPLAKTALYVITPGETIISPAVHLGYVEGDLDTAVQAMHEHLRRSVLPQHPKPERSLAIQFNIPGDQGYYKGDDKGREFNEAHIMKLIDVAVAIGAELFLVDAGWSDTTTEWNPLPQRFPRGMDPIRDYAHKKGLLFGLQSEFEGGRVNYSKLIQEHPDWVGPYTVLRLDTPEVAAFVKAGLTRFIERYKPDLYRNEFIPMSPTGWSYTFEGAEELRDGFIENRYWRYYNALYEIFDNFRCKYPNVVMQECSDGGARQDIAMMSRFHQSYANETGPPHIHQVYSGKTLALPPEVLVLGLGTRQWAGPLDTRLRTQFTLTVPHIVTGVAPSVEDLTSHHREKYLHYADIYKQFIRPLLSTCKVFHHAPVSSRGGVESGPWFAMEFAAPDRTKGWATIVRLNKSDSDTYLFKPKGLDIAKEYYVTFDTVGSTLKVSGLSLIRDGLPIRLESVLSSELLLFNTDFHTSD